MTYYGDAGMNAVGAWVLASGVPAKIDDSFLPGAQVVDEIVVGHHVAVSIVVLHPYV